jgi:hypothetical protein
MRSSRLTNSQSSVSVCVVSDVTKCCQLAGCNKLVAISRLGRPAKFCSPAHKLRAFRARNRRDDVTFERRTFPKKLSKTSVDKPWSNPLNGVIQLINKAEHIREVGAKIEGASQLGVISAPPEPAQPRVKGKRPSVFSVRFSIPAKLKRVRKAGAR